MTMAHAPTMAATRRCRRPRRQQIDYGHINAAALVRLPSLLRQWLPGGAQKGCEYVALNPSRIDRRLGSFRINIRTGRWADFATADKGGDPVSLFAYLNRIGQAQAALDLARLIGIDPCVEARP